MGVKRFGKHLRCWPTIVDLERLAGKVIAVDFSNLLFRYNFMKRMDGKKIDSSSPPHVQGLFSTICILLSFGIKPIFVFDGKPPELKRETIEKRRLKEQRISEKEMKRSETERIPECYQSSNDDDSSDADPKQLEESDETIERFYEQEKSCGENLLPTSDKRNEIISHSEIPRELPSICFSSEGLSEFHDDLSLLSLKDQATGVADSEDLFVATEYTHLDASHEAPISPEVEKLPSSFRLVAPDIQISSNLSGKQAYSKTTTEELQEVIESLESSADRTSSHVDDSTPIIGRNSQRQEPFSKHNRVRSQKPNIRKLWRGAFSDCIKLIKFFGIPIVSSPGEAEAQCVALENAGITQGTITEDSDIWLFGGKTVYTSFSNSKREVKMHSASDIASHLHLNSVDLACLALLCGCDYTEGIENLSFEQALDILKHFDGYGLMKLINFKNWWVAKKDTFRISMSCNNKKLRKLLKLHLPSDFPRADIYEEFMKTRFVPHFRRLSWEKIRAEEIRNLLREKTTWSEKEINNEMKMVYGIIEGKDAEEILPAVFIKPHKSARETSQDHPVNSEHSPQDPPEDEKRNRQVDTCGGARSLTSKERELFFAQFHSLTRSFLPFSRMKTCLKIMGFPSTHIEEFWEFSAPGDEGMKEGDANQLVHPNHHSRVSTECTHRLLEKSRHSEPTSFDIQSET